MCVTDNFAGTFQNLINIFLGKIKDYAYSGLLLLTIVSTSNKKSLVIKIAFKEHYYISYRFLLYYYYEYGCANGAMLSLRVTLL